MDIRTFSQFIAQCSPVALTLGVVLGLFYFSRIDSMHKSIAVYIILMLTVDISSRILGLFGNNFIILPIYSLIELIFFIFFYCRYLLQRHHKIFITAGIAGSCYIIAETISYFILNDIDARQFQPYAKVVVNFVIILLALAYYIEKANHFKDVNRKQFQLNTVFLTVFTITMLVFLPFNFLVNEKTGVKFYFWLVNAVTLVCFELYLAYCIWNNSRSRIK